MGTESGGSCKTKMAELPRNLSGMLGLFICLSDRQREGDEIQASLRGYGKTGGHHEDVEIGCLNPHSIHLITTELQRRQ